MKFSKYGLRLYLGADIRNVIHTTVANLKRLLKTFCSFLFCITLLIQTNFDPIVVLFRSYRNENEQICQFINKKLVNF